MWSGTATEGGDGDGQPTPGEGGRRSGRGAAGGTTQRGRAWTIPVPPGYIDGAGQILGGKRTTFRLPDGVRPGDRVVIEMTACADAARWGAGGRGSDGGGGASESSE